MRPMTAARESTSRVGGSSRSSRACSAPWTSAGIASSSGAHGELVAAVLDAERAALDEVAQRLLEEERVAAGTLGEQLGDRLGQTPVGRVVTSVRLASSGSGRSSISR